LLFCIVVLELGLRIGGFVFLSLQEYRNRIAIQKKGAYRIMCLGESTTALGGNNSYPNQLEEILNKRDIGIKFSVINKGVPGGNSVGILSELEHNLNKYNPDMVITMMGINDGRDAITYEYIPIRKITLFLRSFRIYKLAKLLMEVRNVNINKGKEIYSEEYEEQSEEFGVQEEMLKKDIEVNPASDQAYVDLGICCQEDGDHAKAEGMFKKAIEINPESDRAYVALGFSYIIRQESNKAEEVFKKAIEVNPGGYDTYIALGDCYLGQEKYDEAEGVLKKINTDKSREL